MPLPVYRAPARDLEVTGCARTTYQAVEDGFTNAVARAVAEGDLPEDTNPRELGRLLLTIQQGLQFLLKPDMTPEAMREVASRQRTGYSLCPRRSREPTPRRGSG